MAVQEDLAPRATSMELVEARYWLEHRPPWPPLRYLPYWPAVCVDWARRDRLLLDQVLRACTAPGRHIAAATHFARPVTASGATHLARNSQLPVARVDRGGGSRRGFRRRRARTQRPVPGVDCSGDTHMDIAIPKSLEALVRRKVEEGHYTTEAEVVADALRLMQVRDEVVSVKRARLKDALDRGYEDVAAGRVIEFETEDEIDALFASL